MSDMPSPFTHIPAGPSGTVSWIHLGDLHMTRAGEQNEIDLGRIVDDINQLYADGSVQFVFLPGDIADDGSAYAYDVVRTHLNRLRIPWCGIVGDHDVHQGSFQNFKYYIQDELYSGFTVGGYRFLRLNAFSEPRPDAFLVDREQLLWLEDELKRCDESGTRAVLLLHCYPSDLRGGGAQELRTLVKKYPVLLIDMGHTHYNEISNDGTLLYSATRSTGQIEEGPVGYSVLTLDGNAVSWHFVQPGSVGLVDVTTPVDRRLHTSRSGAAISPESLEVRAKIWSRNTVSKVTANLGNATVALAPAGELWTGNLQCPGLPNGEHRLTVIATDVDGQSVTGASDFSTDINQPSPEYCDIDRKNSIGVWQERGIFGTQLGPNQNGRKW